MNKIIITETQLKSIKKLLTVEQQSSDEISCQLIKSNERIGDKVINYVKVTYKGITKLYKLTVKLGKWLDGNITSLESSKSSDGKQIFNVSAEANLPLFGWKGQSATLEPSDLAKIKDSIENKPNEAIVLGRKMDKKLEPK